MKKTILAVIIILNTAVFAAAADLGQTITKKVQGILPAGWTANLKAGGVKMYERAAQALEIKDPKTIAGFMITITDTNNTIPKDTQHPQQYNPYFEIYFYKLPLTEEQIIKYNRLANAQYNRPAGTQDEYPPRFAFQKKEYVVMKTPAWGKAVSPDIDSLMLKVMSLVRKELP